jgi:hypothetical protein
VLRKHSCSRMHGSILATMRRNERPPTVRAMRQCCRVDSGPRTSRSICCADATAHRCIARRARAVTARPIDHDAGPCKQLQGETGRRPRGRSRNAIAASNLRTVHPRECSAGRHGPTAQIPHKKLDLPQLYPGRPQRKAKLCSAGSRDPDPSRSQTDSYGHQAPRPQCPNPARQSPMEE